MPHQFFLKTIALALFLGITNKHDITIYIICVFSRSQVHKVFIEVLPKILFIQRPAKDNDDDLDKPPDGVLTEVFDVPDYVDYGGRYQTDFDIPSLPPSRYDVSNTGMWERFHFSSKLE